MTQAQEVHEYMKNHGGITIKEAAYDLGITRLAARIHDLARTGVEITKETVFVVKANGKKAHVTRYKLA